MKRHPLVGLGLWLREFILRILEVEFAFQPWFCETGTVYNKYTANLHEWHFDLETMSEKMVRHPDYYHWIVILTTRGKFQVDVSSREYRETSPNSPVPVKYRQSRVTRKLQGLRVLTS